jgi:hypothetical protein
VHLYLLASAANFSLCSFLGIVQSLLGPPIAVITAPVQSGRRRLLWGDIITMSVAVQNETAQTLAQQFTIILPNITLAGYNLSLQPLYIQDAQPADGSSSQLFSMPIIIAIAAGGGAVVGLVVFVVVIKRRRKQQVVMRRHNPDATTARRTDRTISGPMPLASVPYSSGNDPEPVTLLAGFDSASRLSPSGPSAPSLQKHVVDQAAPDPRPTNASIGNVVLLDEFDEADDTPVQSTGMVKVRARAIYDFCSDNYDGAVSLRRGDVVDIIARGTGEDIWSFGLVNGVAGRFPSNYVEVIKQNPGISQRMVRIHAC